MTAYTWKSATGGSWNTSADWTSSGGTYPSASADTATIGLSGTYTVTYNLTSSLTITSLTISNANATLDYTSTSSFSLSGALGLSGIIEETSGTTTLKWGSLSGSGTFEANGGTLILTGSLQNSSVHFVVGNNAASLLEISSAASNDFNNGNVAFQGAAGGFFFNDPNTVDFSVSGLNVGPSTSTPTGTNYLEFAGTGYSFGLVHNGSSAQITVGGFSINASGITNYSNGYVLEHATVGGNTEVWLAICFAAGTRILTATGERLIESLVSGDMVVTETNGIRAVQPIKWIGRRRIDLAAHPRPEAVAPIRIRQGAFAEDVPHADLIVSPDHAILADGMLICARQLINGTTIVQEKRCPAIEYFHVELDAHAILLAEGLTAESYLDTGNRGFFANGGTPLMLHPNVSSEANTHRAAGACHAFVWDEARVKPVWQRLADRAAAQGLPSPAIATSVDPELAVWAKGRLIRPTHDENGLATFVLPGGTTEVRLLSRTAAPTDAKPWLDDRRSLGVNVQRIVLRGAAGVQDVPLDSPALTQGWWEIEQVDGTSTRWTDGDARLPLPALQKSAILLEVVVAGTPAYAAEAEARRAA